ncbi:LysR substrate-binding domain-containing protein [Pseudomonas massiliensis]|uniref:LysR substrate-binding domain-containing protein n=1 Tax=Pseudomonas massiliensis TaxID=522492 RepID=UPI002278D6EB|nr:LysR substrate-binding domain-containing protein [Pseudomonas massiliensis]
MAYFGQDGSSAQEVMSFSHFSTLLDAVARGQGVGLAWRHLVQDRLDDGTLIAPLTQCLAAPDRKHYLVYRRDSIRDANLLCLRDWLLEQTDYLRNGAPP